ncbi:alpha/beta hydrolase [Streptomyces tsukubensis]|nr:alpha/beta hydrolase [Streptomyces tsukubensis]EIF91913.1 alpha/beta hydrolase fold protein [Streptomyces tsukubensis NRRL18488]
MEEAMSTPRPTPDLSDEALVRRLGPGFTSNRAQANGVELHYVEGGTGEPVVLLGGWPQTWWQWNKVLPELARHYRVIAVELRGQGGSGKPADGYDKKTLADDVHALLQHLGIESAHIVGHDIGAMVAHAHAANHPAATRRIALLDVPHPEPTLSALTLLPGPGQHTDSVIEDGDHIYLWWFALNQVRGLPEQLLAGRARFLVDWLADYMTVDPSSIDDFSRQVYARAYDTPDAIRAGNGWYQTFNRDIEDAASYEPVTAPILALANTRNEGHLDYLRKVVTAQGTDVTVTPIAGSGHYLAEEQPRAVLDALRAFLG